MQKIDKELHKNGAFRIFSSFVSRNLIVCGFIHICSAMASTRKYGGGRRKMRFEKIPRKKDIPPSSVLLCLTEDDIFAIMLTHGTIIEISLQKHVRICRVGRVAATICRGGRASAIHHPCLEFVQDEAEVLLNSVLGPRVRMTREYMHVTGVKGSDPSDTVHTITNDKVIGSKKLPQGVGRMRLRRDIDPTVPLFSFDFTGVELVGFYQNNHNRCMMIAQQSVMSTKGNMLTVTIMGVKIKHDMATGHTRIYCGRNFISLCGKNDTLTLHSPWIDINVDNQAQTRLRRGDQVVETEGNLLKVSQNKNHCEFIIKSAAENNTTKAPEAANDQETK